MTEAGGFPASTKNGTAKERAASLPDASLYAALMPAARDRYRLFMRGGLATRAAERIADRRRKCRMAAVFAARLKGSNTNMLDFVLVGAGVGFFAVAVLYVLACERM